MFIDLIYTSGRRQVVSACLRKLLNQVYVRTTPVKINLKNLFTTTAVLQCCGARVVIETKICHVNIEGGAGKQSRNQFIFQVNFVGS